MRSPADANDIIDTILSRRSVRSYTRQAVDAITLYTLLEAAVRAPTAMHQEPWAFVIIQDKKLLGRLAEKAKADFIERVLRDYSNESARIAETFSRPDFNIFYGATTLIVVCAQNNGPFVTADCWLAAENLMLAACSKGLGTCVIGSCVDTLNRRAIKSELEIAEGYTAVVPIIVGYPSGETAQTTRRQPSILAWLANKAEIG